MKRQQAARLGLLPTGKKHNRRRKKRREGKEKERKKSCDAEYTLQHSKTNGLPLLALTVFF